jgi:HTH-type transcriptional repressor of NAD biosynthesis genes
MFTVHDFEKIAWIQRQQDEEAMKTANRVCFFDSDAVTTQYYCEMYMDCPNPGVEKFVDPQRYDLVLMMGPEVDWVDDGLRFKAGQAERERLHRRMLYMYLDRGFKDRVIEIHSPHYEERLDLAIAQVDKLLADRRYMSRY